MKAKLILKIRPTQHNVKTLKERGLFSDDSSELFNCYQRIMDGESYEIDTMDGTWTEHLISELADIGLRF